MNSQSNDNTPTTVKPVRLLHVGLFPTRTRIPRHTTINATERKRTGTFHHHVSARLQVVVASTFRRLVPRDLVTRVGWSRSSGRRDPSRARVLDGRGARGRPRGEVSAVARSEPSSGSADRRSADAKRRTLAASELGPDGSRDIDRQPRGHRNRFAKSKHMVGQCPRPLGRPRHHATQSWSRRRPRPTCDRPGSGRHSHRRGKRRPQAQRKATETAWCA
jgi:hypothetical protein